MLQGRYRILSKIASGAMGVVYRGERIQLGRPVAVKFLHPWIAAQKAFLTRFETEAKAMSRLLHPHCVSVIDFGVEGSPYLVMDFVTGRTLRDVTIEGRLPVARALRLVQQLLSGLAHAHAQGIIHRDLKPENLILSEEAGLEEHLRILDFGLAKLRDGPQMTSGMAVGTPSYMSPEQSGAEGTVDARTDLYTVGVLLFELLAGRKPFQSENVGELILMQREAVPPRLREVAPDANLSAELEAVVLKAMSKHPDDRHQTAAELVAALEATPEARGVPVAAPAPAPKAARPLPAGKTTVDTVSQVRARLGLDAPREAPVGPIRSWRPIAIGGGFVAIALIALLIGRGLRGSDAQPESPTAAAPVAPAPQAHTGPASPRPLAPAGAPTPGQPASTAGLRPAHDSPQMEEARQLIAHGEGERAVALLNQLRLSEPENPDVPYLQALVYFDSRRWSDGLAAAQLAVRKDPGLKSDPDLVKGAIRSLASDRGYEKSQAFLRSLGAPATPFVREAAQRDSNPRVRDRAAELLNGGGRGWGRSSGGYSSGSSGGSMFKR